MYSILLVLLNYVRKYLLRLRRSLSVFFLKCVYVLALNRTGYGFGVRHVQTCLIFLLLAIAYGIRITLSVAIVAMTTNGTSSNPDIPTFDWNNKSVILSSFYWGYVCLQVIAGQLGNRFGPKWLLVGAMCVNATACAIIPIVAERVGAYGVMACRITQGLSQGFFFPSVHNLLGKWAPLNERSRLSTFAFAGPAFGTVFAMGITGFIASSWAGWPAAFYFFAGLGYLWVVVWAFLGADSPSVSSLIKEEEKLFIEDSLNVKADEQKQPTPWKAILTSMPVWAFVIGNFGNNWGYSTLLTEMPTYLNKVMGFDMSSNGLVSAAPYLTTVILTFVYGFISDFLINNGYISRVNARKLCNSCGTLIPALALVVLGFLPKDAAVLCVVMLIIAVGFNAGVYVGFQVNAVDLSPNFSGVLMGIGNGASNTFSIIAPLIVQVIVTDETDVSLWRTVFIIAAAVYTLSDILFIIFAKGEVQWWDNPEAKQEKGDVISTKL